VTARVCVEYFTVGHAPVLDTESPTLLAHVVGVTAICRAGLILAAPSLVTVAHEPLLLNTVFAPWLVTGLLYLVCWAGKWRGRGMH